MSLAIEFGLKARKVTQQLQSMKAIKLLTEWLLFVMPCVDINLSFLMGKMCNLDRGHHFGVFGTAI